jgi:NADP oxidoreductase coenzyme F420-dependent
VPKCQRDQVQIYTLIGSTLAKDFDRVRCSSKSLLLDRLTTQIAFAPIKLSVTMKIEIIGSGNMGRSLGMLWAKPGHAVFFGARTPEKGRTIADFAGHGTKSGTNDEAAKFGDVLLHTARGAYPSDVLTSTEVLTNKILIDPNNSTRRVCLRSGLDNVVTLVVVVEPISTMHCITTNMVHVSTTIRPSKHTI